MAKSRKDLSGYAFGYIKVIKEAYRDSNYRTYWECKCICGLNCIIRGDCLNSNTSCGCQTAVIQSQKKILPNKVANISRIFRQYKRRGLKSGKGFSLSRSEFESLIFSNCYFCGKPPSNCGKIKTKSGIQSLIYNGIDRLDSSLGYHLDNCVTSCIICNIAKSDMSIKEFYKWIVTVFCIIMWRVFHERKLSD
jgi:hypothetical protein